MVSAFPVHVASCKARINEQFLQLGDGPQAPIIGKCLANLRAVWKFEMNVIQHLARNWVLLGGVPYIGEAVQIALLILLGETFVAPVAVQEKHAVFFQARAREFEIAQ